ncbi:MAG: restriction endonuclease subunit S [Proteobacteria bacterium]|nr:restriction endonuclease subunit S [Pseudomonadota bacterium]
MIADLEPYPRYEDSGHDWMGSVPDHWERLRAKYLFREVDERSSTGKEELLSVSHLTGVTPRRLKSVTMFLAESNVGHKICRPGDAVINTMWAWMGALGVSRHAGIVSPAYGVYRPIATERLLPAFADYLLRTPLYAAEYQRRSTGVNSSRLRLYPEQFLRIPVLLPPMAEQTAIVRFLDWANGRLERAIRAKRKVIALLDEQKQAIVHHAVTRGLNPIAPLKPSGVSWLGDVPQHWSLKKFKFVATITSGQIDPRRPEYRHLVLIAPNHIQTSSGKLLGRETADEQGANSGKYVVAQGQVVYSKIRPNLRKATIAPCDCLCSADMYPIAPNLAELSSDYLLVLLLSQPFTKFAVDMSMRVAMPKVNREALGVAVMWYPPQKEQALILDFVAQECRPIDRAISRLEREIELFLEYRTRIVADAVTGKLDVRNVAAWLPNEVPNGTLEDVDLTYDAESIDEETIS